MFDQPSGLLAASCRIAQLLLSGARPDPYLYRVIGAYDRAGVWLSLWIVFAAGFSLLLGHGLRLLWRGEGRGRRLLTLGREGGLFGAGFLLAVLAIWAGGRLAFSHEPSLRIIATLTALSYAPLALGILVAVPGMGRLIEHLLYMWSTVVLLVAVQGAYAASLPAVLLCTGMAFGLRLVLIETGRRSVKGAWPGLGLAFWARATASHDDRMLTPERYTEQPD